MTTKEYLNQIEKITLMIDAKLEERYRLMSLACRVTVPTDGERVKSTSDPDKMANMVDKIIACENEIDSLVTELLAKKAQIVHLIDSIENPNLYNVLTLRYVQFLNDKEIAGKMNIAPSNVYKLQKSALIEFETRYGSKYLKPGDRRECETLKMGSNL